MESSSRLGCTIRNQKDPFQFQCVLSTDPGAKRDFSVYFNSLGGGQELMASCTHNDRYDCSFTREGLSLTGDYISVSETFSAQNGSFVCRNGGARLDQFPCFYSGNIVKPEVKYGIIDNGSNTFLKPEDFETEATNLTVIIFGVVILFQFLVIGILLYKKYKSRKEREDSKSSTSVAQNLLE